MTLYNEFDGFAAAWLGQLIQAGHIAQGTVDARDIRQLQPTELVGHRQVHLFAGIGVWSLALRLAGVPDDAEVWTASCPCQPFSTAGKGAGFADERHLWPAAFHLIRCCRPPVVMGEQVASRDGLVWLDLVQTDLEGEGYTFRAVDTCAAGFGAPHLRQRLYWMGYAAGERSDRGQTNGGGQPAEVPWPRCQAVGGLANSMPTGRPEGRTVAGNRQTSGGGGDERLDDASGPRCERAIADAERAARDQARVRVPCVGRDEVRPGPTNGLWRDPDWLLCRDAKWRPVEPGTFPLADAGAFRNRVAELRGAGNAINVAQAAEFIAAVMPELAAIEAALETTT